MDIKTFQGNLPSLPGVLPAKDAPEGVLVVVIVDKLAEELEKNEYQLALHDCARYDLTLGIKTDEMWATVGWSFDQNQFGEGGTYVVGYLPGATLENLLNPPSLFRDLEA